MAPVDNITDTIDLTLTNVTILMRKKVIQMITLHSIQSNNNTSHCAQNIHTRLASNVCNNLRSVQHAVLVIEH